MELGVPIFPLKLSGVAALELGFLLIAIGEAFALIASGVAIFKPFLVGAGLAGPGVFLTGPGVFLTRIGLAVLGVFLKAMGVQHQNNQNDNDYMCSLKDSSLGGWILSK